MLLSSLADEQYGALPGTMVSHLLLGMVMNPHRFFTILKKCPSPKGSASYICELRTKFDTRFSTELGRGSDQYAQADEKESGMAGQAFRSCVSLTSRCTRRFSVIFQ